MSNKNEFTMKKTIKISEEANMLLKQLAKENDTTESNIFEWAIYQYANKAPRHGNVEQQLEEQYRDLCSKMSKLYEQNYHQLNLLNSLSHHLAYKDYIDSSEQPYSWLQESKKHYRYMLTEKEKFRK